MDRGSIFFTMWVVRHWNRVPRGAVDPLPLEVYKAGMDEALSNLVYWKVFLPTAGGINYVIIKCTFQPKPSMVL